MVSITRQTARGLAINGVVAAVATVLFITSASHVGRAGELSRNLVGQGAVRAAVEGDASAIPTRPLVPMIARLMVAPSSPVRPAAVRLVEMFDPPGDEMQRAFEVMNGFAVAVLAFLLCRLLDAEGVSAPIKAITVLGGLLTVPLARLPAYQPVQVELAACVFVTLAIVAIVIDRRWKIALATVLAVTAHEVGVLVVLFGLYRDWRRGVARATSLATYLPALASAIVLQVWASVGAPDSSGTLTMLSRLPLIERPQAFADPRFLILATYGALTLFGGLSLLLVAHAVRGRLLPLREAEWLVYLAILLVVSIVAGMGRWHVLAYALPAVAVLFARAVSGAPWHETALSVGLATLATQRPWAQLTDVQYLAAWAPDLPVSRSVFLEPHATVTWLATFAFVFWFVYWAGRARTRMSLVAVGMSGAVLLLMLGDVSGRITVEHGYGFDGEQYVRMLETGFGSGPPSMRLRPAILLTNKTVDALVFDDPLATFHAMNLAYALSLALILAGLCRHYGASDAATATLVVNVFLCIAVAKMFAFYPVLVDLGAYALAAANVSAIVVGRRWLVVATSVAGVLSREFCAVGVLFGIVRDLRERRAVPVVVATYAPAVAAFFWIRHLAAGYPPDPAGGDTVLSIGALTAALLKNLIWWSDPVYALFWTYFAVTLFGGVSLFLLTRVALLWTRLRKEPEWLAYVVPLLAVTAVGYLDMWRYSAFVLPVLPAFWSWAVADVKAGREWWLFAAVTAGTIATQRPWQHMDLDSYFRDWFPYYLFIENRSTAGAELWPVWSHYLATAIAGLLVLAVIRFLVLPPRVSGSAPSMPASAR